MRSTPSTPDQQAVAPFASAVTRPSRRDSPPPGLTAARTHRRLVPPPPYASLLRHERADANCALDASCTVPSRQIRRLARKSWRMRAGHRHEPEAKTTGSASAPAPADNAEARSPGSEPPESRAPARNRQSRERRSDLPAKQLSPATAGATPVTIPGCRDCWVTISRRWLTDTICALNEIRIVPSHRNGPLARKSRHAGHVSDAASAARNGWQATCDGTCWLPALGTWWRRRAHLSALGGRTRPQG